MKKTAIIILSILVTSFTFSQTIERQVIGSTGGEASNTSIKLSFTVGESVVKTFTSGSITLTQGFQQVNDSLNTGNINEIRFNASYKLYPNPTNGNAKLELLLTNNSTTVTINVYSTGGKLIENKNVVLKSGIKTTTKLNLENQARGIYFIKVYDEQLNLSKTLKISKY